AITNPTANIAPTMAFDFTSNSPFPPGVKQLKCGAISRVVNRYLTIGSVSNMRHCHSEHPQALRKDRLVTPPKCLGKKVLVVRSIKNGSDLLFHLLPPSGS